MADFRTHITVSTAIGIAYGGGAIALFDVPIPTAVLAGGLCSVAGMLPDVDSDSGIPLRESLAFGSAVVPMMFMERMRDWGFASETMILVGALLYLLVRFGFGAFLKRYTVHRGMFHSLPAALIFAEVAFLLASGDLDLRLYKAGGVALGYLTHLALDEIWSLQFTFTGLRVKKSFGTAIKFFGRDLWANTSTYVKLGLLTLLVLNDPIWVDAGPPGQELHEIAIGIVDTIVR